MKKLLVLALGFALMACTNPMTDGEEVPAVETDAELMEEAAATEEIVVEEAVEEVVEEAATE